MIDLLKSKIGRLRVLGYMEGTTLILLLFVAMPLKYVWGYPQGSHLLGTLHGALFLLFIMNTISVGVEQNWKFSSTTWKVMLACMIPFGTFYIDKKILRHIK